MHSVENVASSSQNKENSSNKKVPQMTRRRKMKRKTLHIALITCSSPAIDWFGNTGPYCQTMANKKVACFQSPTPLLATKQTSELSSSPGHLLSSRPHAADKGPPWAGNLHLPGLETEEVSHSQTSDRATTPRLATPQEACLKTPLGSNFGKVIIIDIGEVLCCDFSKVLGKVSIINFGKVIIIDFGKVIFIDFGAVLCCDFGEVLCCNFGKVLGRIIIIDFSRDGLDSLDAPDLERGNEPPEHNWRTGA